MSQPFKLREKVFLPNLNKEFPPIDPNDPDEDFPDHTWTFWSSPSPAVFSALLVFVVPRKGRDYTDEEEKSFLSAIPELVLDTGESEVNLGTPEEAKAAIFSDIGSLVGAIITTYTSLLYRRRVEHQKKILARSNSTGIGTSKPQTASTSPT